MANKEHLAIQRLGKKAWAAWRWENPNIVPDLSYVDLTERSFLGFNLVGANLEGANLSGALLRSADLSFANIRNANLTRADLSLNNVPTKLVRTDLTNANLEDADLAYAVLQGAVLQGTNLRGAILRGADLLRAKLSRAFLCGASMDRANLTEANLEDADLTGCRVYGVAAWGLNLQRAEQKNLIITKLDDPEITVDNLEMAQFIYLLLNNEKIRRIIDTITSKVVLILGRFTQERKSVLDSLREELRKRDYLPILFDFDVPTGRDVTETVSLLARMARFVVADLTDAKSIPQELGIIVPDLPSVPVQPLLLEGSGEYSMFEHFRRFPWVLPMHIYGSPEQLIAGLGEWVIGPAEAKSTELRTIAHESRSLSSR